MAEMDVRTLIAPVRDSYVKAFERAVREFKLNRNRQCLLEYSFGQGEEREEGRFSLPVRHDLLPLVDGWPDSITTIREDKPVQVTASVAEVGNIPVTIRQFAWDHFELRALGVNQTGDLTPVLDWFDRWFDRIGRRPEMAGGIRGVVHSLDGPFWTEHGMTIEVDLGTATSDALLDLLYAVSHLAPTGIEIISPSFQPKKDMAWNITVPDGWEQAEEIPGQPITYTKEQSVFRVEIEEGAALSRNVTEAELTDAIRRMAVRSGARKTAHVISGICPIGLYAVIEWRTLEHGTIRLWMLSNHRDLITASLIGDDLAQRDIRQITDSVMAIAPKT
jgi:hypothetical protein